MVSAKLKFKGVNNFIIVCDETNNNADIIDRDEFICDVYVETKRYRLCISKDSIEVKEYKLSWELV